MNLKKQFLEKGIIIKKTWKANWEDKLIELFRKFLRKKKDENS